MPTPEELQAQKQQMVQINAYAAEQLDETNSFKHAALSQAELASLESGNLDEQTAARYRERLKDMMMIDQRSAEALKDQYGDVYKSAKKESLHLQTQASRSGLAKACLDITGKKKKAAKKKVKELADARAAALVKQGELDRENAIKELNEDFAEFIQPYVKEGKIVPSKDLTPSSAMEMLLLPIDYKTMEKDEIDRREKHNAPIKALFDPYISRHQALFLKIGPDSFGFSYMQAAYESSRYVAKINKLTGEYQKDNLKVFNEKTLGKNDIHRDVCRWISPMHKADEAKKDDVLTAYTHARDLYEIDTPVAITDAEKSKEDLAYLVGKMDMFAEELKQFQKTAPKSIFTSTPDYNDMLLAARDINEIYKKSQSLVNIGCVVISSPVLALLETKEQKRIKDMAEYIAAMSYLTRERVLSGRKFDKLKKAGQPLDYTDMVGLKEKLKSAKRMLPEVSKKIREGQAAAKKKEGKK